MALVTKFKRGQTWYLRYARGVGLPKRSLGTSDEKLAEAIRVNEEQKCVFGKYGIKERMLTKTPYSVLVTQYLAHKEGQGRAQNTLDAIRAALNNFGSSLKHDVFIDQITMQMVEDFAAQRRKPVTLEDGTEKKRASEKTIRNELVTLKTAFKWAMRRHYCRENPVAEVELPKKEKRAPRNIQDSEYFRLMKVIKDQYWRDLIDFYLLTGIRREEGLRLRVAEHIDFDRGMISLPQGKTRDFKVRPLTKELRKVLNRLVKHADASGRFIHYQEDTITAKFRKYRDEAGLSPRITFHSLRHTFASNLAASGASFKTVQELLGQSDPESTKVYCHPFEEEIKKAAEKIQLPKRVRPNMTHPIP